MAATLRLFIAIELTTALKNAIDARTSELRNRLGTKHVRWTPSKNLHLTLKFLGDTPPSAIDNIKEAMVTAAEGHDPFVVSIVGVGCFPNIKKPRIIWLGLSDTTGHLITLQKQVEQAVAALGFPPDERTFRPHLTIGRVKKHVDDHKMLLQIGQAVKNAPIDNVGDWQCTHVALMQSDLTPSGAIYSRQFERAL